MRLICPACGASASMEAWVNDANVRQVIDILSKLPGLVATRTPAYLGLFRKGPKGLSWPRALRIVSELHQLVSTGSVHWENGEERPAPPSLWADIMDKMIARAWADPLDDNNYLRKVVWSEAKPLAVQAEGAGETKAKHRLDEADPFVPQGQRKKSCYTCNNLVKPKGCKIKKSPASNNMILGCRDGWVEKSHSIGEVAKAIAENLQEK